MQFQQLRYFITLVEKRSFTEAAREHFVTQSALSQQIKVLEQTLGVELCQRRGRVFDVTPAGMLLYERAVAMMAEIEDITHKVKRAHQNKGSSLRLGLLSSMHKQDLPKILKERVLVRTGFELNITYGSHDELYDLFGNGSINAFISDETRLAVSESFNKVRLFSSKIFAEIPRVIDIEHSGIHNLKVDHQILSELSLYFVCELDHAELEMHMLNEMLKINGDFEAVESIADGRKIILQNGTAKPSALIVDRSLLRQDEFNNNKFFKYEIECEGKPIKRPLCCYARKNIGASELHELCDIVMELGAKENQNFTHLENDTAANHSHPMTTLSNPFNHNHIAL